MKSAGASTTWLKSVKISNRMLLDLCPVECLSIEYRTMLIVVSVI